MFNFIQLTAPDGTQHTYNRHGDLACHTYEICGHTRADFMEAKVVAEQVDFAITRMGWVITTCR